MKAQTQTQIIHVKDLVAKQELGRRVNNKARTDKVRAKAWWLPFLTKADFAAIAKGETVRKEFKSGRVTDFVKA
jgi:hypothetical protein